MSEEFQDVNSSLQRHCKGWVGSGPTGVVFVKLHPSHFKGNQAGDPSLPSFSGPSALRQGPVGAWEGGTSPKVRRRTHLPSGLYSSRGDSRE